MLEWLGTKTGLKTMVVILAVALVLSIASQIAGGSGIAQYLTGASSLQDREDPVTAYTFGLEVEGNLVGFFTTVSGIGSETEIVERKVVDDNGVEITHFVPGRLRWTSITLSRGLTTNLDIWEWRQRVVEGRIEDARADCSIVLYDEANQEIARWNLEYAWPSAISAPAAEDESTEYLVESITLVHEGMERVR